jgi:diamine N-acetyltransferase
MAEVTLREVTADNVTDVCKLELGEGQERFVAPAAQTVAQAHYYEGALLRAIYAGDVLVGVAAFEPEDDVWWLWRLMIDHRHQRRGYGAAALARVLEVVREKGAGELRTSYAQGDGEPRDFYLKYGFEDTGRDEHGERVLSLQLA